MDNIGISVDDSNNNDNNNLANKLVIKVTRYGAIECAVRGWVKIGNLNSSGAGAASNFLPRSFSTNILYSSALGFAVCLFFRSFVQLFAKIPILYLGTTRDKRKKILSTFFFFLIKFL